MENREPVMNDPIDQLTLDFLMNRTQYKKYVAKNDPTKHIENEKHLQKLLKYKNRISNITSDLLDNPETMITLDVSQSFDRYVRTLIRHFETKDLEKYDNDVLFDDMDDSDNDRICLSNEAEQKMAILQKIDESIREPEKLTTPPLSRQSTGLKSFWGKHLVKKT